MLISNGVSAASVASEPVVSKRRGGRAARKALRAAPVNDDMRPIRPGMEAKGRYRILSNTEMHRIHQTAVDVLEQMGISENLPSTIEYLTGIGCKLNENGRITFPRALVEDFIARANRDFLLAGRDPRHDISPRDNRVYFGTAGAAVNMVKPITGAYRETTLSDLYDCSRLADTLGNIHFFQRTVTARDIDDPFEMDFNTCYASLAGISKYVGCCWGDVPQLNASFETLHMLAGGEKAWRERTIERMDHTLASHYPAYIPAGIDKRIREKFPVRLAPERMRPNPCWPRKWTQSREDAL